MDIPFYRDHLRRNHSPLRLFLLLASMSLSFVVISLIAIFYSLGYQVNWQAHTIQQTGIISADGHVVEPDTIKLDGSVVATRFPYRLARVFPGEYTLTIEKAGYQTWSRRIDLPANTFRQYSNVLLFLQTPKQASVPSDAEQLLKDSPSAKHLSIKNNNELWLDDVLLVRTSQNIVQALWYPDDNHIVYQSGTELLVCELDGRATQTLTTFTTDKKVPVAFSNEGQVLLYQDETGPAALQIY